MTYTVQGVRKLLARNGWSCQAPRPPGPGEGRRGSRRLGQGAWPCAEDSRR
ncbi:winged helix-turn-helix domain-containing protein [Streptomyces rubiginosohelvolus]|uniref:winged helix-turn-helix domain-containing protein n=1 Tax=Streptomyces rubiginosohelvolus TaxID=67362 RepID=UPI0036B28105